MCRYFTSTTTVAARGGMSVTPKALEAIRRQLGIPHGVRDVPVSEVVLDRARVPSLVGELEAVSMAQHVWMDREAEFRFLTGSATILRAFEVVIGPPRSVVKTYCLPSYSRLPVEKEWRTLICFHNIEPQPHKTRVPLRGLHKAPALVPVPQTLGMLWECSNTSSQAGSKEELTNCRRAAFIVLACS